MTDITERLRELSKARWDRDAWERETTVRIPAEPDRDIDLVLASAAELIDRLRARVAELEAADGICFTGMIVNINGHDYGLRPGAARIVREALRKWGMIPLLLNALQVARDNIDPDLEPDDIALIDAAIDAAKDGA